VFSFAWVINVRLVFSGRSTIECDQGTQGLPPPVKGRVAAAGRFAQDGRGAIPYSTRCFHLDVGACQVDVWHSDAVMQPGPRNGPSSTTVDRALPRVGWEAYKSDLQCKRHALRMPCRSASAMLVGYCTVTGVKQSETRQMSSVGGERRGPNGANSISTDIGQSRISNQLAWRRVFTERHARSQSQRSEVSCPIAVAVGVNACHFWVLRPVMIMEAPRKQYQNAIDERAHYPRAPINS